MKAAQTWISDTDVVIDLPVGATVERELTGFCGSRYGDRPPLTGPVAEVNGGELRLGSWPVPLQVVDGVLRHGDGTAGDVGLAEGVVPATGGSVVENDDGTITMSDLRLDLSNLLPLVDATVGPALASVTVSPDPGGSAPVSVADVSLGPQLVGDGLELDLCVVEPAGAGPTTFVVTGGRVTVQGAVLQVGARAPLGGYAVRRAPEWERAIAETDHRPLAAQLRRLADEGELPVPVLRRFALEGANWMSRGGFDLPGHLTAQLAVLPDDKRSQAASAAAAAVALVLERLLTKAAPAGGIAPPG